MAASLTIALLLLGQAEPANSPADAVPFAELSADERLAQLKKEASEYSLFVGADDGERLVLAKPVLRFNDNVSGVVDAVQLLWFDGPQPHVTASFWRRKDGLIAHEFQSLSSERVIAKVGGQTMWHPLKPGVEPQPLADAPEPAKAATGRLSQMRTLARGFSAAVKNQSSDRSLRLLTQPIARYGKPNADILDAAWFVFAKGTNPEVMVLIESRRKDDTYAWHYSPVRMTSRACELKLGDVVVWSVKPNRGSSPEGAYRNIYARESGPKP